MAEEGAQWEVEALALKKQGDTAFGSGDYAAAVTSYTSAISIDDSNHLFYSNRAACYLKLNEVRSIVVVVVAYNPQLLLPQTLTLLH